ncbi:MAG: nucleoside-triphosphatase, partial [Elusimicrobia bacterium]|nr:nucleoside-triphosphatase [Candidatus Obscuribacterium magneticum]
LGSKVRLNKYGIDLNVLDKMGVKAVEEALKVSRVVVVDEIGTMEMMSPLFCETIAAALIRPTPLLATIRLKAEPFTSQIKKLSDTLLLKLDRDNFLEVKEKVRVWLSEKLG